MATFKSLQAGSASHLRMTGDVAGAISGGLTVASMIVRMVHDMVRDAISDVIGKLASKVAIGVLTAGLAAPWAVSTAITEVSSWVTRLSKEVTDTVLSAKNLKDLLSKATHLLDDVGEKFAGMVAMALGYGSKNADNAAKGAKHADDAADAAKGAAAASAVPPKKGGAPMWCVKRRWVVSWLVGGRRGLHLGSWRAGSGCGGGPGRGRPGPRRFALVSFALVVGPRYRVGAQRGEGGGEHGALEPLVATVGDVLTTDR